jgi:hypothetical protein
VETEGKFQRHAAVLDDRLAACDGLLATLDEALDVCGRLRDDHRAVAHRTSALHTTCQRLVAEREAVTSAAAAIAAKLAFFDELERVGAELGAAGAGADAAGALPLLQRLDDCLEYVAAHPQYADAAAYSLKFRQLQARALGAVRGRVGGALRAAAAAAQAAQREAAAAQAGAAAAAPPPAGAAAAGDGGETALLYIRFRAAAEPALQGLLAGVEARAGGSADYGRLLRDCQALYCEARLALARPPAAARLRPAAGQPLAALLRAGCAYLLQVAQLERQLFAQLFPGTAAAPGGAAAALAPLLDPLCTLLYDAARPALVGVRGVDELVELADILREEVLEGGGGGGGGGGRHDPAAALLDPVLRRALGDVQERLAYRAAAYVREGVAGFVPGAADLDYPAKLQRSAAAAAGGGEIEAAPEVEGGGAEEAEAAAEAAAARARAAGWYPPVARALLLLSKLYRAVPPKIFNGLAHEAVAAATASVGDAQRALAAARGPVHAQLFAVAQLLVLREQIAPFEADFAVTERGLDFSHTRDYLRRTLSGQLPLFSLGSESVARQLVAAGGPRLAESQLDAKKELERRLKATCEGFIMHATKLAVEPLLSFLTKVTAVRVAGAPAAGTPQRPLREQAFAAADRLAEVAAAAGAALAGPLPEAVAAMRLYLPSPATQAALLKPIRANVAEAHAQVAALVAEEYTAEEAATVGLPTAAALEAALEALCG